jgi:hypothetical protein
MTMEVSSSNNEQLSSRSRIFNAFLELNPQAAASNPFLGVRTPLLAKALSIYNVYSRIVGIPGDIVEFGVWYAQNIVLCENLRSILEPFNIQRRFWGYDTFTGYPLDDSSGFGGQYSLGDEDFRKIKLLLNLHEQSNTPNHVIGKTHLVNCDIRSLSAGDLPPLIALCMVDVSDSSACSFIYTNIFPRLIPGSILLIDDFTNESQPESINQFVPYLRDFSFECCPFFPTRTIAVKR